MYKLSKGKAPETLTTILPSKVKDRQNYRLRNNQDITTPATSTTLFQKSFYPSTINKWNDLSPQQRNAPSVEAFKDSLKPEKEYKPQYLRGEQKL
jgi:hypothetical protein